MKGIENMKNLLYSVELFLDKMIKSKVKQTFKHNIQQKESEKQLGRWNIDYCSKKINNKVDLSNEDHCGPCGQYALSKNIEKSKI
jgi:hypothetical protein